MATEGDGGEFSSAKLREFVQGRVKTNADLYPHTGIVEPGSEAEDLLSFFEALDLDRDLGLPVADSRAAQLVRRGAATRHVGASIRDVPSYAVGITDQDVEISEAQALVKIATSIYNERAPYIGLIFGGPNRGKTGFAGLWGELWTELLELKYGVSEGVVVSNMDAPFVDELVRDYSTWRDLVLGDEEYTESNGQLGEPPKIDPEVPIWWHFDECSTHLDARTRSKEVSELYLPMVKRFAKVRVDAIHIGHSTLDIYKDLRRNQIATEVVVKSGLKVADVYEHATEIPTDLKYRLWQVPKTKWEYDPDDYSPWSW